MGRFSLNKKGAQGVFLRYAHEMRALIVCALSVCMLGRVAACVSYASTETAGADSGNDGVTTEAGAIDGAPGIQDSSASTALGYVPIQSPARVPLQTPNTRHEVLRSSIGVPETAEAVVLHLEVQKTESKPSIVNVFPCSRSAAMQQGAHLYLNERDARLSITVTVPLDRGNLCIESTRDASPPVTSFVTAVGYYAKGSPNYLHLDSQVRLLDTRLSTTGDVQTSAFTVQTTSPNDVAVVFNLASTGVRPDGGAATGNGGANEALALLSYPCGAAPSTGTIIAQVPYDLVTAREIIAPVKDGTACFAVKDGMKTEWIVDRTGGFGPSGTLAFVPLPDQLRVLDQRTTTLPQLEAGVRTPFPAVMAFKASAITAQITLDPQAAGDAAAAGNLKVAAVALWGERTSSINYAPPRAALNQITYGTAGGTDYTLTGRAALIVDVSGYYVAR
jgi:hypothetical protein